MADPYGDLSDLDFDEDGIYRERRGTTSDAFSGLDEDGILLDDDIDSYDTRYSLHRSDSGFGTGERKRTRRRHPPDIGLDSRLHGPGGFDGYREDSYPVEEHSLNISDLEASDSRSGVSSPLDHRSLDSSIDLDYDKDQSLRRPRRRHRFTSGDDYIPSDGAKSKTKYNSSSDEETTTESERVNYQRLQEKSSDVRNIDGNSAHNSAQQQPHDGPSDHDEYNHDTDTHEPDSDNQSNSIDYLLQDRTSDCDQDVGRDSLDEMLVENSKVHSSAARSIFTQDDGPVEAGGHSLIEFEELEAAMVLPDGDDLIGAYLREVTNRDQNDDAQNNYDRAGKSSDSLFNDDDYDDDEQTVEVSRNSGRDQGSHMHRSGTSPFEDESLSLIENQQPPFPTSQMSFDTSDGGSCNNTRRDSSSTRGSRIPMLRSRSPSMSRPGSAQPRSRSNSRPSSRPDSSSETRSRSRTKNKGRTLPKTPTRRSVSGSWSRSRSSSLGSPLSENRSSSIPKLSPKFKRKMSNQTTSSEEDQTVDRTVESFADDAEVASLTSTGETNKKFNKSNRPRPASAGSNVKPPVLRSKSEATINMNRPSSAKQTKNLSSSRSNTPKSFRVRSQSTTALIPAKQPLKASHNMGGNILQEGEDGDHQQKLNEETLTQLQQDYTKLLKKYAEAENTIDSLRIGAKIPISIEVTGNGALGAGQPSPGGASVAQAIRRTSIVSTGGGLIPPNQMSRPPSRLSTTSALGDLVVPGAATPSVRGATPLLDVDPSQSIDEDMLHSAVAGEAAKLSILAKAKAVEEQTVALQILLNENHLSVEDQSKALTNIKNSYDALQRSYREAKDNHEILRRQGKLDPMAEQFFDDEKVVEGDLYKLGMKLDDLEHTIQNNVKVKSQPRKPFQGTPMKADHSIGTGGIDLPSNRPPSTGSYAGGPAGIDQKVHQLDKEYSDLMDQYRRLKQMRKTPERDAEVERCLKELKGIYEQTPEHRRPPLPPELEKRYSSRNEYFVSPMQSDSTRSKANRRKSEPLNKPSRGKLDTDDDRPSANDSDLTIPRELKMLDKPKKHNRDDRLGYTSSATASSSSDANRSYHRRKAPARDKGSFSSFDSLMSDSSHRGMYKLPPRRDREDKDSGYVGSEASRKTNPVTSLRLSGLGGRTRTSSRSGAGNADDSDITTESDDRSTVEYVKPHRPSSAIRRKISGEHQTSSKSPGHTKPSRHGLEMRNSISHGELSETDETSYVSNNTKRSSFRSEQIQNLQKEVNSLKKELQKKNPGGMLFTTNSVPNTDGGHQQPQSQQYGGYYYYPGAQGPQDPSGYTQQGTGNQVDAGPVAPSSAVLPPHFVPYNGSGIPPAPPHVQMQPTPLTVQKVPYTTNDHMMQAPPPQDIYYGPNVNEHYMNPYHSDTNKNYRSYYDDDVDSADHGSPHRRDDLRSYYIPSRYRSSSPSRRRSRRDDYEYDKHKEDYDRPRTSSGHREIYSSPERYSSPDRRSASRNRRRIQGYRSPVRAYPNSYVTPQYPSQTYAVPPPPPAYGSQQHLAASQQIPGQSQYYPIQNTQNVPGTNFTAPSATNGAHVVYQQVPTQAAIPGTMHRSQSLPMGTLPLTQDSSANGHALVPFQIVPVNSTSSSPGPTASLNSSLNSSKVRYYVREYGTESDAEEYTRPRPSRRSRSLPRNTHRPKGRTGRENYYSEMEYENEIEDDLDSSISSALKTAAELKKMSNKMKASLRDELSRSYRDSSILSSYLD